ncbi:AarF/ABC1/UbiB kinase family protein [Pseudoalteromonas sp. BZP1]|uniref:ABC1 kinase family protein n=1 Tax=unclassified Pseudoalteromonas TaxID=194690 RepID=UPI0025936DEB|nr:AarF/ABC1/UbiB kinase family protein [uncultured Pseudoalteromonas sp.]
MSNKQKSVPTSRFSRAARLGSLAGKVAGNMLFEGTKAWATGKQTSRQELLLQPKNIQRFAEQLANLRGAAMKLGQLLSMDSGELLTPELSAILARLRSEATPMPQKQLVKVMREHWGDAWLEQLSHFELRPFAAASIGQVHIAYRESGEKLAVKVQYPGIAKGIASDVDNLAYLLKLSGLLPKEVEIQPLIDEAKQQLINEANYELEANYLKRYSECLKGDDNYLIPNVVDSLSSSQVLVMSFVEGQELDELANTEQALRNKAVEQLLSLFLRELFSFKLVQTDPNFANYQYQIDNQRLVLLDFGATRELPLHISDGYLQLLSGAISNDRAGVATAAQQIGYFQQGLAQEYIDNVVDIFLLACEPLRHQGEYDFANSDLPKRIKELGLKMSTASEHWHAPPVDALFVHRKLAGLFLIAAKLSAKVNVNSIFKEFEVQSDK